MGRRTLNMDLFKPNYRTKPKLISLFTGAGGLDFGLEAAGFDVGVAVEMDADSCRTVRQNRNWDLIERDIHKVPTGEMLEHAGLRQGHVELLVGGPPCQPFSKSGYWANGDAGRLNDPRARTLEAYLRVVEEALPQAFLLENVHGLAFSGKDEGLQHLLKRLGEINKKTRSNYIPHIHVLNAANYGVPQHRQRVFVIASRDGRAFTPPPPTHVAPTPDMDLLEGTGEGRETFRTAWDAIGDIVPDPDEDLAVRGKWAGLLPSIPEGENYLWHTDRGGGKALFGWRTRYWSFLLKLAKDRPSWTIQAQPGPAVGPLHWHNRRLSIRELCRLQTFPDDVWLVGNRASAQRQIGNAVPSLLGEVLGREIRKQLLERRRPNGGLKLLPPVRRPVPARERLRPVPKAFLRQIGNHEAHPGTGKGRGARARSKASAS